MAAAVVGFIGLGAMGWPMAARLATVHHLLVFDIDAARAEKFAGEIGGTAAQSLAELAASSEVIITMLPTSREVEAVLSGPAGILDNCRTDTLIIEMSSGAPQQTRLFSSRAVEAGCRLIDAPVSGGVPRARTGELSIMAGGEAVDIRRAEPILKLMGSAVLETGSVGSGHAMKALNNLVSACTLLATIEAAKIGEHAGLDPKKVVDILNVSTGMSNSSLKKMHQFVLPGTFNSGFDLSLMVKDLNNAIAIADDADVDAALSERCVDLWRKAALALGPGHDHTAIAKTIAKRSPGGAHNKL